MRFQNKLYKFIKDRNLEYHWEDRNGDKDVMLFVNYWELEDFHKLISNKIGDWDDPFIGYFRDGYVCFWMSPIFDYIGRELNEVFEEDE